MNIALYAMLIWRAKVTGGMTRVYRVALPRTAADLPLTFGAAAERVALQLPPRRAASDSAKMPPISRAEGGQLQAPVGPRIAALIVVPWHGTFP